MMGEGMSEEVLMVWEDVQDIYLFRRKFPEWSLRKSHYDEDLKGQLRKDYGE